MVYEFDSEIKMLEGKIKWKVVYFPYSVKELFNTNGKVSVEISVDGHKFDHTLLPSKNGHYLVYNEFIRRAVQKEPGEREQINYIELAKKEETKNNRILALINKLKDE